MSITKRIPSSITIALGGMLLIPTAALAQLSSTIEIIPNPLATPTAAEVVTIGVPFASCALTDLSMFTLKDEANGEVAIFIKETLGWPSRAPCAVASTRAAKVQFVFDATAGAKTYTWELTPRTTAMDIPEIPAPNEIGTALFAPSNTSIAAPPIAGGLTFTAPRAPIDKTGYNEPRVFGINNAAYVVKSGIIPPTASITGSTYDTGYFPNMWEWHSQEFDYDNSRAAHWLFDRVSTNYIQAARRGTDGASIEDQIKYYREAYLSHEFYIDKIDDTGTDYALGTTPADYCLGGFNYDKEADHFTGGGKGCDSKYIYAQPLKLHLALTGDDSFEPAMSNAKISSRDDLFFNMADVLFTGSQRSVGFQFGKVPATGFAVPFEFADKYTERKSGLGLQTVLNVCELTLDGTVCGWADTIIENMYEHKTNNPDALGDLGYLGHSWFGHETPSPWIGEISADVTNSTTIVVDKTIGDVAKLVVGNEINVGNSVNSGNWRFVMSISSNATNDLTEVWTIGLSAPVTVTAGSRVLARRKDLNNSIPPVGTDNSINTDLDGDRAFSPWMQSNIADGVWQYYNWVKDDPADVPIATSVNGMKTRKEMAQELLLGFGEAIAKYSVDGRRLNPTTKIAIEVAFGVQIHTTAAYTPIGCGLTTSPMVRYGSGIIMDDSNPKLTDDFITYVSPNSTAADQHIPENLFQLSLGIFFETDPAKKAAMEALANDMLDFYDRFSCTSGNKNLGGGATYPRRAFNWQNKPDPFGTYQMVKDFSVTYDTDTFLESVSNNGSITTTINLTLGGDTFVAGPFAEGNHYDISASLPPGLTAVVTRTGSNTATFTLTNTANDHEFADSIVNLGLTFNDSAFTQGSAIRVTNSAKADFAIVYTQPTLTYDVAVINESQANDGSVSETFTITLSDDTFIDDGDFGDGDEYNISNVPPGLTAEVTRNSPTQVTVSFTGTATSPHNTDVTNLTLVFTDEAFVIFDASGVLNFNLNNLQVLFVDPSISYDTETFVETNANTGVVSTVLTLTLSEDIFASAPFSNGNQYNISNTPAGLAVVVTRVNDTTATVALTGAASPHVADISNFTLNFDDSAFTTFTAAAVTGSSKNDLAVDFKNPNISYDASTLLESNASDGTIVTTLNLTLTEETFTAGPFNAGDEYNINNVPSGLSAVVTRTNSTTVTLTLSGTASAHSNADDVSDFSLVFTDAAFTTFPAAAIPDSSRLDLLVDFSSPSISYNNLVFVETNANDGMTTTTLNITLNEDTFTAGPFNDGDEYNVSGVPAGLTAVVTRTSNTTATFELTGMAGAHANAQDIANIQLMFTDAAFGNGNAAGVQDSDKTDIAIDFVEPTMEYDLDTFVENNSNNGSFSTVLNLNLLAEGFVISGGVMTEGGAGHYTASNVPAGLTLVVTGTSATTATAVLNGNAGSHGNSDDVSDLTIVFLDAAFTGNDASAVLDSSKTDLNIDFIDAMLSYSAGTFSEAVSNNGSIGNTFTLTLTAETFVVSGGIMTEGGAGHFTVTNVPSGLTVEITGTSTTTATVVLSGNASSHASSNDISNLTITFLDAAFGNGDAAAVQNATKANIVVDFDNAPAPPPSGGSGPQEDLVVPDGGVVQNDGEIVNLVNAGTVIGGTLSGEIDNSQGTIIDVTIAADSIVSGGLIEGDLSGSGTIENALLDVSSVSEDIVIGKGTKVTSDTVSNVPGLVLTNAIRNDDGTLNVDAPLLVDNGNELSVSDISKSAVDSLFQNSTTDATVESNGIVEFSNSELVDVVIPVKPLSVVSSNLSDGVSFNRNGELEIVSNGLLVTYAAASADQEAFKAGIESIGANANLFDNGLVIVEFSGNSLSLRFKIQADTVADNNSGATLIALNGEAEASFQSIDDDSNPNGFRILITYPDGTTQDLLPELHNKTSFAIRLENAELDYEVSAISGIITILENQTVVGKFMPSYTLEKTTSPVVSGSAVQIETAGDLNSDGINDYYFITEEWTQALFGLPL